MWARLDEKETGLGWNSVKNTIIAPPEWWQPRLRFLTGESKIFELEGTRSKIPELKEKCFKDVVAIGYVVFMPHEHILSTEEAIDDEPINDSDYALEDEGVGKWDIEEHPLDHNQRPSVQNNDPRKRKRGRK
ncbi:hypothetical protein K1719_012090 [Acacia pycnantha]|nr:hypothetical protein K1719_012090 [Acacia pycnantha]